jgi:hypothetical protein
MLGINENEIVKLTKERRSLAIHIYNMANYEVLEKYLKQFIS